MYKIINKKMHYFFKGKESVQNKLKEIVKQI